MTTHGEPRLHALDNLRAGMMWLGIVLHVAAIHITRPSPLPWRDERTTPVADLLMAFIHAFRMPVFFILAGFFLVLLVERRGVAGALKNRLLRLGLPFAVFWLPLFALVVLFALLFAHRMARGTWGLDLSLMPVGPSVPAGPNTIHMWFLWMLLWFSMAALLVLRLAPRLPVTLAGMVPAAMRRFGSAWWGFVVLALPLAWIGSGYPDGLLVPGGSFLPPAAEWLHNGLFFLFGMCLHGARENLLALYQRRWLVHAIAGLFFFLLFGALIEQKVSVLATAFAYYCAAWLWSFALLGIFLRYVARPSALLSYLAASSYWVYLVHMPLTIGFGALLYGVPLPALAKMSINVAATTLVCLLSYHWFVRFTAIGLLLSGARHTRPVQALPRDVRNVIE